MSKRPMLTEAGLDRDAELDELQQHVEIALGRAAKGEASEAEVSVHASQGLSVLVRMGDVETLEHMKDRGVSVSVMIGRRKGNASSGDLSRRSIELCVDKALDIARFTQEDPCNGLADPALLATRFPDLDIWHPVGLDARAAISRALECENAGREEALISNSEGASFDAGLGLGVYGNSNGFIGRSAGTRYSQSCVLIAGKGDAMQRDYSYDSRRDLAELEAAQLTGREAARRTVQRLGARKLKTGRMPVLFAPEVAKGLIGHLVGAISGTALYRNASFLKNAAGQQLFPDWLQLSERPHLLRGAASAAFDSEGVATLERDIVQKGVLQGYVLSTYSARRLGLQTTGNSGGVRNLQLLPGGESPAEPLKNLDRGFFVTEVMGQGVSLVTGDYSRGASGFLVENGNIAHAVEEVTIAGNLADMFRDIISAGSDVDTRGNVHSGSLLIEKMTVAGS